MNDAEQHAAAERLFESFLAPLVLGGALRPGKPFGGALALALGERTPADVDRLAQTLLARVRVARALIPIDTLGSEPTPAEWALACVLHDSVQATHPGFDAAFKRTGPTRLLDIAIATLERITPPTSLAEALSRHTWLSRIFEITRTDIELSWWTGSERFLGTTPPKRLLAWREVRRVTELRTPRTLMDLPVFGAMADFDRFSAFIREFLAKTPLTDLATATRSAPRFAWTRETIAFCKTFLGKTLALRALARLPADTVEEALGRATRPLLDAGDTQALSVVSEVLSERALERARAHVADGHREPLPQALGSPHGDLARSLGASTATAWLRGLDAAIAEHERRALTHALSLEAGAFSWPGPLLPPPAADHSVD